MVMPNRDTSFATRYRYGFNGKEQDKETYGQGNEYDYGFRIYNPRIGRFLSVDPLTSNYPFYTPFQFASNMPIAADDLDGLESHVVSTAVMKTIFGSPGGHTKPKTALDLTSHATTQLFQYKTYAVAMFCAAFTEELPKKFIKHYAWGLGTDYHLNRNEMVQVKPAFTGISGIITKDHDKFNNLLKTAQKGAVITLPEGYSIQGGATTGGTLGRFRIELSGQITIDKNDPKKWSFEGKFRFVDQWDFETKDENAKNKLKRSDWGEIQTQTGGTLLPGRSFEIRSDWVDVKQTSADKFFDWFNGKDQNGKQNKASNELADNPNSGKEVVNEVKPEVKQ
jgi:RHS repeat-associated protein